MTEKETHEPARLRGMDLKAMTAALQRAGESPFRAKQLLQWVYQKGASDFECMTNLSKDLRAYLGENFTFGGMTLVEAVGTPGETQKLVFRADDGLFVESVLMREEADEGPEDEEYGEKPGVADANRAGGTPPKRKLSLCVSSQVGCVLDCSFCMTGYGGFRRNLRVDEILDQVIAARRLVGEDERLGNLVFMGMGESMLNLGAVIPALRLLTSPQAFDIATRRITVSTAGVLPGLRKFAEADTGANLAVSLNATTQKVRDRLMPGCRKWPIPALLDACRRFPLTKRRRITFEYVLLKGINDTPGDRKRLTALLRDIRCKINLILFNPDPRLKAVPTAEADAAAFQRALSDAHYTVSLRRSKGRRHHAACGQLAAHMTSKEYKS